MDLTYPPEAEEFRAEVRSWLAENLPPGRQPDWSAILRAEGWLHASWPVEHGGKGLTVLEQVVLNEELARAGAPLRTDFFADTLVGPTLLRWGTEEQKRQFLPPIRDGEVSWCQGFSEPDAGSDLASLRTTAVLEDHAWVVDGHKVWTTNAQNADYMFLLARTAPDLPKHAGLSCLLLPMKQDGIEVRPIRQLDGSCSFNEVFISSARCPEANVVGGLNNGWKVAMASLDLERGASATVSHRRFERELDRIVELARQTGRARDPLVRQRLAQAWSKVKIMQINGYRTLTAALRDDRPADGVAATAKMFWSEYHREVMELAIDILGMEGQILTGPSGVEFVPELGPRGGTDFPVSALQASFFFSRSETIWGGTAEIQRNLVGERVLGLPKEPEP